MNIHRLDQVALVKHQISVAVTAAATSGAALDTAGFDRALFAFYGAPTGTGTTVDGKIQECATSGGSYVDVASSNIAQVTTVGGAQLQLVAVNLGARKRFLKAVITGAGGSAAGTAYANVTLIRGESLPPTQDNTVVSV